METFASLFSAANFDRPNKLPLFSGFMSFEVLALPPELLFFLEFRSLTSLNDDFERAWINADRKFGEKNAYNNGLRQELPYAKQRMMISKMTKLSYLWSSYNPNAFKTKTIWKGVQQTVKTIITATIIRVTRFLFSWFFPEFLASRNGPGPWPNAAEPLQSRISMLMYNARIATSGVNKEVANITVWKYFSFISVADMVSFSSKLFPMNVQIVRLDEPCNDLIQIGL